MRPLLLTPSKSKNWEAHNLDPARFALGGSLLWAIGKQE